MIGGSWRSTCARSAGPSLAAQPAAATCCVSPSALMSALRPASGQREALACELMSSCFREPWSFQSSHLSDPNGDSLAIEILEQRNRVLARRLVAIPERRCRHRCRADSSSDEVVRDAVDRLGREVQIGRHARRRARCFSIARISGEQLRRSTASSSASCLTSGGASGVRPSSARMRSTSAGRRSAPGPGGRAAAAECPSRDERPVGSSSCTSNRKIFGGGSPDTPARASSTSMPGASG